MIRSLPVSWNGLSRMQMWSCHSLALISRYHTPEPSRGPISPYPTPQPHWSHFISEASLNICSSHLVSSLESVSSSCLCVKSPLKSHLLSEVLPDPTVISHLSFLCSYTALFIDSCTQAANISWHPKCARHWGYKNKDIILAFKEFRRREAGKPVIKC